MRIDILDRTEDPLAEQAIALWLLGAIIDRLWLENLAVTPL